MEIVKVIVDQEASIVLEKDFFHSCSSTHFLNLVPNILVVVVVSVASFGDDICRTIQAVVLETALITDKVVVSNER